MEIRLEVIDGKDKGKSFRFTEADRFIVGRDAAGSMAHYKLGADDRYVSRNHFILEIRPPRCYIKDNQSMNGTFVKVKGQPDYSKVSEVELHDGDSIKAGFTVMSIAIVDEPEPIVEKKICAKCSAEMTGPSQADGICDRCRQDELTKAAEPMPAPKPRPKPEKTYRCIKCGKDVSAMAVKDGRAEELDGIFSYLCRNCAASDERDVDIQEIREYRILRVLGRGGMGVVYKAWHKPTGRLVALKKILPEASMNKKLIQLFQREISVMSSLKHQNIVRFFDSGTIGKDYYFTTEFLTGGDAEKLLTDTYKGPVPVNVACDIVCQALSGLEYAHSLGYIHRDIKPQNILLSTGGTAIAAKISDFGLSKLREGAGMSSITMLGEFNGTPFFMAPEQLTDYKNVKPSADVYSMGVTLYFLLTANYQYHFPSPMELLRGMLRGQKPKDPFLIMLEEEPIPARDRNPAIPMELARVVDKSIRKNKNDRYSTASELKEAILKAQ